MTLIPSVRYRVDPLDPRAPSQSLWDALTEDERAHLVQRLPRDVPRELLSPEAEAHQEARERARAALERWFARQGQEAFVGSALNVYYPGERAFAPDLFVALGAAPRPRSRWVVSQEGRGLDLVLQIHVGGSRERDYRIHVARFARLSVREYFVVDTRRMSLTAYRLVEGGAPCYRPLPPQEGRTRSEVLGLELAVELGELRLMTGG